MNKAPSKYHQWVSVGPSAKDADEFGRKYIWDSSHPDLEPTETFTIGSTHYCSYCCKKAYPIQAGLRPSENFFDLYYEKDYSITGYCCICNAAEAEKELRHKKSELMEKHQQDLEALNAEYAKKLSFNNKKRLQLLHAFEREELRKSPRFFTFRDVR